MRIRSEAWFTQDIEKRFDRFTRQSMGSEPVASIQEGIYNTFTWPGPSRVLGCTEQRRMAPAIG
jgi:hypothetical protein